MRHIQSGERNKREETKDGLVSNKHGADSPKDTIRLSLENKGQCRKGYEYVGSRVPL